MDDQSLVYLEQPITREALDNLNDDWIAEHGVKLDINQLLAAPKQQIIKRQDVTPAQPTKNKIKTHTVAIDPHTNQRESWPAIAEQYGLYAKQLLELNPHYDADPSSLKVGDILIIQLPAQELIFSEKETGLPAVAPCTYSCALNSHYAYSDFGHPLSGDKRRQLTEKRAADC